jgi:hypothetical protein
MDELPLLGFIFDERAPSGTLTDMPTLGLSV